MKIMKLGHCCFVAEPRPGVKIMTDPGAFSIDGGQSEIKNITAVLITHEHQDHLHIDSLKNILKNNPYVEIITNSAVGKLLDEAGIKYTRIADGDRKEISGVTIQGFGTKHAEIYGSYGQVENTGFMVDSLCFPGGGFENPNMPVDILALPVAGPWMKIKEAIVYAKSLKPRIAFPVHDAFIKDWATFLYKGAETFLKQEGIEFKKLELGKEEDL